MKCGVVLGVVLLAGTFVAADVGYVVTPNSSNLPGRNGTVQWYAHGTWWCILADPANDHFVWRNDLPLPATPGTQGGWTKTNVRVDPKSSTRFDLWYNAADDVVHVLRKRSSGPRYNELVWNATSQTYEINATLGDVTAGLSECSNTSDCGVVVDTTGQVFVANDVGGTVNILFTTTSRATWSSVALAVGVLVDNSPALAAYNHPVTGPGVALIYWKTDNQMVLRTHDDEAGDTGADWTEETVLVNTGRIGDDHNILRTNGGDLHVAFKDGANNKMYYTRRLAGGPWASPTLVGASNGVRKNPTLALIGSDVYLFWQKDDTIVYRKSDQQMTSFGPETSALIDLDGGLRTPTVPKRLVDPGSGLLVIASNNDSWHNLVGQQTEPSDWYRDLDGDGFGDPAVSLQQIGQPQGYVADSTDCNDNAATVNPAATEICDALDNDCDTMIDESAVDALTWYRDDDADGFGDPASFTSACTQPAGFVADGTDCNDAFSTVNPGAPEICDGLDNDCNGMIDEGVASNAPSWYRDADTDGFGETLDVIVSCGQPAGYVSNPGDCDDGSSAIYPGAPQLCNGLNDDCNDAAWPQAPANEADGDGDGFRVCENDCDDGSVSVNPDGVETCNGSDDDCDGLTDEDAFGEDSDGDSVLNLCDNCPTAVNPAQDDTDSDTLGDACDNCPAVFNPDQADVDGDTSGNVCDDDDDGDGFLDGADNCPLDANAGQEDRDLDGIGDICDTTLVSVSVPAARCVNGIPSSELDLPDTDAPLPTCFGTSTRFAGLDFSDDAVEAAEFHTRLPIDWTGDVDVTLGWFTGDTAGSTDWQIEAGCVVDGMTDMTMGPVLNPAQTVGTPSNVEGFSRSQATFYAVDTDGCQAGNLLFLRITRDNADSNPSVASLVDIEITLRRNQ